MVNLLRVKTPPYLPIASRRGTIRSSSNSPTPIRTVHFRCADVCSADDPFPRLSSPEVEREPSGTTAIPAVPCHGALV